MKERELKFVKWFNLKTGMNLIETSDEFSTYDFFDDNYIVELKIRNKYYKEKAIQIDKLFNLIHNSRALNKTPLYIVTDDKGVYVFNINKINLGNKKMVEKLSPVQTEFENNKMIKKYFFLLGENEASKIINYQKK